MSYESDPRAIVGVGASAGGLDAFTQLLSSLPIDTGLTFVLVQHLDPRHDSNPAGVAVQLYAKTATDPPEQFR
jgi:chemotaxis response regulator CheB